VSPSNCNGNGNGNGAAAATTAPGAVAAMQSRLSSSNGRAAV